MIKRQFIGRDLFYMIGELESEREIEIEDYNNAKYRYEDEGRDIEDRHHWFSKMCEHESRFEDINREIYELREYINVYGCKIDGQLYYG